MSFSDTPKATLTVSNIGPGLSGQNVGYGITNKVAYRRGDLSANIKFSNRSILPVSGIKSMTDVIAAADYKLPKSLTLNTEYELGTKCYKGGLTWDGTLANKSSTLKGWYTNKDKLAAGEATVIVNSKGKANTTFNQKQLLTAKYTYTKDSWTVEPSYSFLKASPAVAVTKRIKKEALKASYDLKSEAAALEWNHTPHFLKVTLSAPVGAKSKFGKPSLSAVFEKTYDL